MRIPLVSENFAVSQWNSYAAGGDPLPIAGQIDYLGPDGEQVLNEVELEDLYEDLESVRFKYDSQYPDGFPKSLGGRIESELVVPIHKTLSSLATPGQLSHVGFWRWLSNVAHRGKFWQFIDWRFEERQQVNWAITSPRNLKESLFFRCWVRGEKMYNPELPDPYRYAKMGTGDFWRSHILRQDFGKDRAFVEAFLDFNFDPDGTRHISDTKLRKNLIPAVRAWSSMATFSQLSYDECTEVLKRLWEAEDS